MTEEKEDEGFKTQPKDDNPGKGRGPPRNPPGFKGRPAGDMPENVPDHVEEKLEEKPEGNSQGRLGLQVLDENGEVKEHNEYTRIPGEGSVELKARKSEVQDGIKWLKTRRDKVPGQGDK